MKQTKAAKGPLVLVTRSDAAADTTHRGSISARPGLVKLCSIAADLVAICLGMLLAFWLRAGLPGHDPTAATNTHLLLAALSLPVWIGTFAHQRLYTARFVSVRLEEFSRLGTAAAAATVLTAFLGFAMRLYVTRGWLALMFPLVTALVAVEREGARRVFAHYRRRGHLLRTVLIAGRNTEGFALAEMFATDPSLGYEVAGFLDDDNEERTHLFDRPIVGKLSDALEAVDRYQASGVVVATTAVDLKTCNRLCRDLTDAGIHVELSSSLRDIDHQRLSIRGLGRFPVVYIEPVKRGGWRPAAKRAYDLVGATAGLTVLSPLLAVIAVAIRLGSPGPVLLRQDRVGQGGEPFTVFKFRTMVDGAHRMIKDAPLLYKPQSDSRVTRIGRILRNLSLDELPQLWNVLRGEMSLVGPRPALEHEMKHWTPELHNRLRVRPGITGMWQVGRRPDWSFEDYIRYDLYYVDNWSLWTDLAISFKTVAVILFGRGNR